jgi:hypothetical protein
MALIYVETIIEFPVRLLGGIVKNNVKLIRTEACGGLKYLPPLSVARGAFPPFFDTNQNRV